MRDPRELDEPRNRVQVYDRETARLRIRQIDELQRTLLWSGEFPPSPERSEAYNTLAAQVKVYADQFGCW